jgi:hypothetical protein
MTIETPTTTSPLQAAREWRAIPLVVAARASGLGVTKAEALEEGRVEAFASAREMIASAVLYASAMGIGRDEAMALLDRTVGAIDQQAVEVIDQPTTTSGSTDDFSAAVTARRDTIIRAQQKARIAAASTVAISVDHAGSIAPEAFTNMPRRRHGDTALPMAAFVSDVEQTGELPVVGAEQLDSPTVRAAMEVDPEWADALAQSNRELDAWTTTSRAREHSIFGRVSTHARAASVKLFGEVRTQGIERRAEAVAAETRALGGDVRTRLGQSEHATLVMAVVAGIVLLALLVAIASVTGSTTEPSQPTTQPQLAEESLADDAEATTQEADAAATTDADAAAATPTAPLAPSQLKLQVLNAGSQSGIAHDMAAKLEGKGYKIVKVGNSATRYGASIILAPQGLEREAQKISKLTGITTLDTLPGPDGARTVMVVLV